MSYVPDDLVIRRVEFVKQGDRQLDYPEAGPNVTTSDRAALDQAIADVLSQFRKLLTAKALEVRRRFDGREQCHERRCGGQL
jgi:hypothetical protein